MPASSTVKAVLALVGPAMAAQMLAPTNDINLPASETASEPLKWLGANSPWFAGPNVYGISPDVPENCYVDQAAYVARHGSRYPDSGAYSGWVDMQERLSSGNYTPTGSIAFMKDWRTVLTDPDLQIAMESPTGAKEAHDLGYTLRTRYPQLYNEGDNFYVWANNYTRVLQTAQMFVQGYLGFTSSTYGSVVAVTSTGYTGNIGNSLAPSDQCPNFHDSSGGDYATEWADVYIPPIKERLEAMILGNFTFENNDISQMPYLCGFESQITGKLSPWCGVFTDYELQQYEYANDIRYYYGLGPGTELEQTMMMPYLNALVGLLEQGPGINGTAADGSTFTLPSLLTSFLNDGQLAELVTASGVFDDEPVFSGTEMNPDRLFIASHFVTMRGAIAFERLNCVVDSSSGSGNSSGSGSGAWNSSATLTTRTKTDTATATGASQTLLSGRNENATSTNATYVRIKLNDAVYTLPSCKDGPGQSCLLSDYVKYVSDKYAAEGNWAANCNVTTADAPTVVQGASFYTDLTSPWLKELNPGNVLLSNV
ncbi:Acid phosphatase PHO1 [Cytospora mali]|uniref:3-phytase n=1 Tax=Cytospora mali TaxID=578113 RepID=A0A194VFP4_CYTMA|nr:Acid phosphatase PHO1 [Valsa mali var. pyri (nom. inval.)]